MSRFPKIEHAHDIQIHRADEWSGLYVDGELIRHGDHYLADEALYEMFGVQIVDDPAWLLGGDGVRPHAPAEFLAEVEAYAEACRERERQAAGLEAQAAELERQAKELRAAS
jgi:hypothetical protein